MLESRHQIDVSSWSMQQMATMLHSRLTLPQAPSGFLSGCGVLGIYDSMGDLINKLS